MFLSLKTLYRKRTVIWPFYFYTIIRTLSLFLYKNIILNKGEDELVVRLIVILSEMGEVKLAKKYISSICSSDIKIKLEKYLEGI